MNTVIKKTAIAAVAFGTFAFAASLEAYYNDVKRTVPTLTRKALWKAVTTTFQQATNYQQATGLSMSNERALELIYQNAATISAK